MFTQFAYELVIRSMHTKSGERQIKRKIEGENVRRHLKRQRQLKK